MPTNKPEVVLPELPAHMGTIRIYAAGGGDELATVAAYTADQLRAYGQACIATLTRPADGGFVMVPREATGLMLVAGEQALGNIDTRWEEPNMGEVYTAMLFAAPQQTGREVVFQCPECGTGMEVDSTAKPSSTQSQQPAEAVANSVGVCKWWQQDDGYDLFSTSCGHEYMVNDCADGNVGLPYCPFCARRLEGHAWAADDEAHPVYIAPLSAPPAIDIGKLRELVTRWREESKAWPGMTKNFYMDRADELAALIGDGGEKGNG